MDETKEIAEKIAAKRKEKGWTQRELAHFLHVSDKNVSKWECGRSVPDIFYLKRLADLFGVTVDYFVKAGEVADIGKDVGRKIAFLREKDGKTVRELAERFSTDEKTVEQWERGEILPDIFTLKRLADLFDVTLEYFIGTERIEQIDENAKKRTRAGKICLTILLVLALMPLLAVVIGRLFLPDTVPCHYDIHGEVTRWGNPKELIAMGATYYAIVAGGTLAMYLTMVRSGFQEVRRWMVVAVFAFLALTAVVFVTIEADIIKKDYELSLAAGYAPGNYSLFDGLFSVLICTLYAVCGAVCVFMPKNPVIGVRIPYSLKGKKEWAFVNAFTGTALYIVSVALIALTGIVDYPVNLAYTCAAVLLPVAVAVAASFGSAALHKRILAAKRKERELLG